MTSRDLPEAHPFAEDQLACSVKKTHRTPNGFMPTGERCGKATTEEWGDDVVGWVNEVWASQGFQIMENAICESHMDMCPEI